MYIFERTSLWKRTLGEQENDEFKRERGRLREAYLQLRENASVLVAQITRTTPDLTIHDITHLDSLWETADTIVGNDYQINPLEAFILGGAILLHDSALCFEAYENGQSGIRESNTWKDNYASLKRLNEEKDEEDLKSEADFIALRSLHANQAENLIGFQWNHPSSGSPLFLIENSILREKYGKLIGKIAASHHWNIEELLSNLPHQESVYGSFPSEWQIDPVKIACILRCADAAHIDSRRAPDFLFALLKIQGISFDHWNAQNKLAKIAVDLSDSNGETLLITSTDTFTKEETSSWFVAYDAACLIDKEINSSNKILVERDLGFKIKKVKGVVSLAEFSKYVKVEGWMPIAAEVHVGNMGRLIENLGGEMLYGKGEGSLAIVIRELIQNSRDSIIARKQMESSVEGKILIEVFKESGKNVIRVTDNGCGMSERVILGALLDFGTSFWTSDLVKSEFPGLLSSSFESIGKFGIGFYSIFMVADQVTVTSKRWDSGLDETNTLSFDKGFTLRPIFSKGRSNEIDSMSSTSVKIVLKDDIFPDDSLFTVKSGRMDDKDIQIPFYNYVATICVGIDVNVFLKEGDNEGLVHQNILSDNFDVKRWLHDFSYSAYQVNDFAKNYIENNSHRLKRIFYEGKLIGFAAISTTLSNRTDYLSISTVGGLSGHLQGRDGSRYIGFMSHPPKSAKRDINSLTYINQTSVKEWAERQMKDLMESGIEVLVRAWVAPPLSGFGVDPTPIAAVLINLQDQAHLLDIYQLADLSLNVGIGFIKPKGYDYLDTNHKIKSLPGYALAFPLNKGNFSILKLNDHKVPTEENSLIGCLYRVMIEKGLTPEIRIEENIGKDNFGRGLELLVFGSSNSLSEENQ